MNITKDNVDDNNRGGRRARRVAGGERVMKKRNTLTSRWTTSQCLASRKCSMHVS